MQQTCVFDAPTYNINTVDAPSKAYWRCVVNNVKVLTENEPVTTLTTANTKQITDVTAFLYNSGCLIKFITNSIYTTFPNLEHFFINDNQGFEFIRPEFLKNASKLITLIIRNNIISKLDANIFVEAPTLEHINLHSNKIETIDRSAFNGLPKLQNIFLNNNKVTNLHPATFKNISKLQVLNLLVNSCINKKYTNTNALIAEIAEEIEKDCKFIWTIEDVLEVTLEKEKMADKKIQSWNSKMEERSLTESNAFSSYIKNIRYLMKVN